MDRYINPTKENQYKKIHPSASDAPKQRPQINVILGGSTLTGNSNHSRKAYARNGIVGRECMTVGTGFHESKKTKVCTTPVIFTNEDVDKVIQPYNDALVVTLKVMGKNVHRIIIDIGSLVDIIFKRALEQMDIQGPTMEKAPTPLLGFMGGSVWPLGIISLLLLMSGGSVAITTMTKFVIVDQPSSYNAIWNTIKQPKIRGELGF